MMRIVIIEDTPLTFQMLRNKIKMEIPEGEVYQAESLRGAMKLTDSIKEKCIWIVDGNFPTFDNNLGSMRTNGPLACELIFYRGMNELVIGYTSDPTIFEGIEDEAKPEHILEKDKSDSIPRIISIIKEAITQGYFKS